MLKDCFGLYIRKIPYLPRQPRQSLKEKIKINTRRKKESVTKYHHGQLYSANKKGCKKLNTIKLSS